MNIIFETILAWTTYEVASGFATVSVILLSSLVLWLAFLPTAAIVHRHRRRPITNPRGKALALLWVGLFVLYDGIFNFTIGAIVFMEPGTWEDRMLTMRMKKYIKEQPWTWRGKLATFICKYLVEPWDWNHCGLEDLD